jgi:hypothetical protein
MNLKRIATLGLVGGAVAAAWLVAAASTSGTRTTAIALPERAVAADASSESLAKEVARLHDRLRPSATPRQPARNLFQFTAMRPAAIPVVPKPVATETVTSPLAPPPPPFKLIGIAEDPGPEAPVRTAIVSAPGQLFLVKEGQNVTLRYRVAKISADVVELTDLGNGATLRLALK